MDNKVVTFCHVDSGWDVRVDGKTMTNLESCTYYDIVETLCELFHVTVVFKDNRIVKDIL